VCKAAERDYQRNRYRCRRGIPVDGPGGRPLLVASADRQCGPGAVETGVQAEIYGVADARPGLVQVALALARILDDPNAVNQQPAAAKTLTAILDKLQQAGAAARRGGLALLREMSKRGS
jgi:hypothetical protein